MKLLDDFGVRALLATVALVSYEALLFVILVILYKLMLLDASTGMAIGSAGQAPVMLSLGFYFGTKSGTPPPPSTPQIT